MKLRRLIGLAGIALALPAAVLLTGCSKKMSNHPTSNMLPEVQLTAAPIDTTGQYFYSYTLDWVGFDPDGRVDYYLYAIDPKQGDTTWVKTTDNEKRLVFQSPQPFYRRNAAGEKISAALGRDFHVFAMKAVDNRGGMGPTVSRAFWSFTEAPTIRILNPAPSAYFAFVTPALRVSWGGQDPDGVFTTKPVRYKYILLGPSSTGPAADSSGTPVYTLSIQDPDSLRRYYEKYDWADWITVGGDTTTAQFTNLTPNQVYIFIVIAFDEAGAYSPYIDYSANALKLNVGFAGNNGPVLTMFNEFFNYTYPSGGFCICDKATVKLEVPAGQPINMNWFATPTTGSDIVSYSWGMDIEDPLDQTIRQTVGDLKHWSSPSLNVTAATVGPFRGGEIHFFFIETEDNNGLRSLGIVRFTAVQASLDKPLLIVDDTRLRPDIGSVGASCPQLPFGIWPTRAEMDTFLFAKGTAQTGHGWQCYPGNPPVPRGIFDGYGATIGADWVGFDTLGTRVGLADLTVPLSRLGPYAHIIWMTDGLGALNTKSGQNSQDPMTAIRYMGLPGKVNTLATYVKQGGKLWMNGGGAGSGVSYGFNDPNNDRPTRTWSSITSNKELGPGRFMYDIAKWQSTFRILKPDQPRIRRALGRWEGEWNDNANAQNPPKKYAGLPPALEPKDYSSDPLSVEAPTRVGSNPYSTGADIEFIDTDGNIIQEDVDPSLEHEDIESTLDTLYRVSAATLPDPREFQRGDWHLASEHVARDPTYVVMTYYDGPPPIHQSMLMSGFPLWYFKRAETQQLVDHVLQQIWGMTKIGPVAAPVVARRAGPTVAVPSLARTPAAKAPVTGRLLRPWSPQYPRE